MLHMSGDYENAIKDLTIAIENPLLTINDKAMAFFYRFAAKYQLGDIENAMLDQTEYEKINPYNVIYERVEGNLIARNIPACKITQSVLEKLFVSCGDCDSVEDIQKFDNVWIIKKK